MQPAGHGRVTSRVMRRFAVPGLITLIAAALLGVLAFGVSRSGENSSLDSQIARADYPVEPGAHTPLPRLGASGRTTLASLRGHFVMVDFFAGWCDACQADANVVAASERVLARHGGTVLGVTFQDSSTDALGYMRDYHLSFPVLHDTNGTLASDFGVDGVPESFIIDPQGKVVALSREQLTNGWLKTLNRALAQHA